MAYTERYVSVAGAGAHNGTSAANAWTLAEGLANAVAAERVNVIFDAGGYSLGADAISGPGNIVDFIVFRGYESTIGDLEGQGKSADTPLDTTNFPVITLTGTLTLSNFSVLQNMYFTGALSGALVGSGTPDNNSIISCKILNTQNNANARAFVGDNNVTLINSDFRCTGAAHNIVVDFDTDGTISGCRFQGVDADALVATNYADVEKSTFIGNSKVGIGLKFLSAERYTVKNNTFYSLAKCVEMPNVAQTRPSIFIDNHATDSGVWLESLYAGTADNA